MTGPDPAEARRRYDNYAATYDRQLALLRVVQDRVRRDTIARLGLQRDETVVDVGCGTGASFPGLVAVVGPGGRVIGVDQSDGMLAQARRRVERAGWTNVELIDAPVQEAALPSGADAALFFFTHDLLRTSPAVANVVAAVRLAGRIAAAGVRRPPPWTLPLALPVLALMRHYVTTAEGLHRPWDLLAQQLGGMDVELRICGLIYVAVGVVRTPSGPGGRCTGRAVCS